MNTPRARCSLRPNIVVLLAQAGLLVVSPGTTHGQNGTLGIAYPVQGITVDGDLSDWPKELRAYPIERIEFGDVLSGSDDLKASFRIGYNPSERALYVAVEVRDNSVVLEAPGELSWNGQDGCDLFIDAIHDEQGAAVIQYARWGNQNRVYGPPEASEKSMKVAVASTPSKRTYEWRVETGAPLDGDRTIGFDVVVGDKDKDGSFSWAAWGKGTQKLDTPNRCGEVSLVHHETQFGSVSGRIAWRESSASPLPARVRIQSADSPALRCAAIVDPTGSYRATDIPVGSYLIHAVDSPENRVEEATCVCVRIEAANPATAELLRVVPVPWPGLIGSVGVLKGGDSLDTRELERFVKAYMDYLKIPGLSLALIRNSAVVYHHGFGISNTATKKKVTDDTVFEAASMTKPVLAYVVMRLVDRGTINLDTPLYTYLPYEDIAYDERYKLITARMVLTHRTGFPNWRTGKLDIKFTPGTKVSYSGEGFVYLGKVVEHLTGKKLVELCQEEAFGPLGIEHAWLAWNDGVAQATATGHNGFSPLPKGKPREANMAYSLHIGAEDYARFLTAVVQGKGLSQSASQEMLRSQVKIPDEKGHSWGLGIAIEETTDGTSYGHGGRNPGFTSRSVLFKDKGAGYVFLINNDEASKLDKVLSAYLMSGKSSLKDIVPNASQTGK